MLFWALLAFPLIWPFIAKYVWGKTINGFEMGLQIAICCLMVTLVYQTGKYSEASDVQVLSGEVTSKDPWRFACPTNTSNPCRNGYSCNCVTKYRESCTGSGKDRRCTKESYQECDTCYKYSWEQNWYVTSNLGTKDEIDRVDAQGAYPPPRWTSTRVGEPYSTTAQYMNWVKGAENSLFHETNTYAERFKGEIPEYPIKVYDLWHVDRALFSGVNIPADEQRRWSQDISEMEKELGPKKQANVITLVTKNVDPNFMYGVQSAWQGAKKNDIVVIIGVDSELNIVWTRTFSWSKSDRFNIEMRDRISELKTLDRAKIMSIIKSTTLEHYERRSMKDFEYLKDAIEPPTWVLVIAFMFSVPLSLLLTWVFHKYDVPNPFEGMFNRRPRSYRR